MFLPMHYEPLQYLDHIFYLNRTLHLFIIHRKRTYVSAFTGVICADITDTAVSAT